VEGNQDAPSIRVVATYDSGLRAQNCHFEGGNGQLFIDGDGLVHVDFCHFGSNTGTSIHLKAAESSVSNCKFASTPTNETIIVDAQQCRLSNLFVNTGQAGASITFTANALYSQGTNLYLYNSGRIDATTPSRIRLSDIHCTTPTAATNSYAIDIGSNQLEGALVDGFGTSTCHGIRTVAGSVSNCEVQRLANGNGITATGALATLVGNRAFGLGSGTAFVYAAGNIASGNFGYPTSASDSDSDDVITLNAEAGAVTTKSLTTAAGSFYLFTLNNSLIAAGSRIQFSARRGSTSAGTPVVANAIPGSGSVAVAVFNVHPSNAFNGTVTVDFQVVN
jgi:hypothetical protein